jgi:hypothetical protein
MRGDAAGRVWMPCAREGQRPLAIAAGRPLPKKASGMEAEWRGPSCGSVHDSPTPKADAQITLKLFTNLE